MEDDGFLQMQVWATTPQTQADVSCSTTLVPYHEQAVNPDMLNGEFSVFFREIFLG